ncbi:MAG: polysaccharide deacetylase family protein [Candidatus Eremiobacteraeota bacterium]|nr:polysaccharide deacetylase family protein [Candidatus Eremiobacteraeota bacterium]MBV8365001.1 polysaccharide deacetylase family protein [Candidatus Eremiobacteraeota bacterium]
MTHLLRRSSLMIALLLVAGSFALCAPGAASTKTDVPAGAVAEAESVPSNERPRPGGMAPDGRVWYVPMARKEIALTFDDGPYPFYTPLLLHQLEADGTPATFFLVGRTMQEYPELVARIRGSGSEIGNHTYNHFVLTGLTDSEIEDQIQACAALIERDTGEVPTLFRPPHGRYDTRVVEIAARLGYRTVLWSDAPNDAPVDNSDVPVDEIVQRVLEHARPGGIILLHSGQYNTIEAIPAIVAALRANGYSFVTVSRLIADQGVEAPDRSGETALTATKR